MTAEEEKTRTDIEYDNSDVKHTGKFQTTKPKIYNQVKETQLKWPRFSRVSCPLVGRQESQSLALSRIKLSLGRTLNPISSLKTYVVSVCGIQ